MVRIILLWPSSGNSTSVAETLFSRFVTTVHITAAIQFSVFTQRWNISTVTTGVLCLKLKSYTREVQERCFFLNTITFECFERLKLYVFRNEFCCSKSQEKLTVYKKWLTIQKKTTSLFLKYQPPLLRMLWRVCFVGSHR